MAETGNFTNASNVEEDIHEIPLPGSDSEAVTDSESPATDAMRQGSGKKRRAGFLSNTRLGVRISIVALLPLVAASGFGIQNILREAAVEVHADETVSLASFSATVSSAIHELQIERELSTLFIRSGGKDHSIELTDQRRRTDAVLAELAGESAAIDVARYGDEFAERVAALSGANGATRELRRGIDAHKVTPDAGSKAYTERIENLLSVVKTMMQATDDGDILRQMMAYISILKAKEFAGRERVVGAAGIGMLNFSAEETERFISFIAQQNEAIDVFNEIATEDLRAIQRSILSGPAVRSFFDLRAKIIEGINSGLFDGVNTETWLESANDRIELMHTLEHEVRDGLLAGTRAREAQARENLVLNSAIVGGTVLIVALLAFFTVRGITRPVTRLTQVTERLAQGDLDAEIDIAETRDEIGRLVAQVKVFKDNLIETKALEQRQAEAEKLRLEAERKAEEERHQGEVRAAEERRRAESQASEDRRKARLELASTFEAGVGSVIDAVTSAATEMQSSSQAMSVTADQTSQQSTAAAAATEQASANVQTVAAAAEELSASIQEISRQVSKSSEIARSAVERAQSTNEKVLGLSVSAQKIGDVVELINDIASQTNLLALNATIEAARAGEAGKGFAVVATEVKSLADQTAKATEEIAAQIGGIQAATNDAVDAIRDITSVISDINEIAGSIASAVEEQGASTQEISNNVQQAAAGTHEVSSNMASVTQAAQETGNSASQVQSAAHELSTQAEHLKRSVDEFLETIRAA
ncbi:MAG: nitrate- and nitrite sensing domain-containing protein [Rhodospirillaceae bacterium]